MTRRVHNHSPGNIPETIMSLRPALAQNNPAIFGVNDAPLKKKYFKTLKRSIAKLLTTNRCFVHESSFFLGKDHDTIPVFYIGGSSLGDCNSRCLCRQSIISCFKLLQGGVILKENHFAVCLAPKLETNSYLFHFRFSYRG